MFIASTSRLNRFKAASIHLGISLAVAVVAALLVFLVWYPYPYGEISGGRSLFLLVVAVDVVMGPLLTLAVFDVAKPRKKLVFDLAIIGLLQVAALAYGLWTVMVARPVHLVFEIDRFRVVHAIDVDPALLKLVAPGLQQLPLAGPTLLSVRPFKDGKENFDATVAALQGVDLGARPDLWQSYATATAQVVSTAKPLDELKTRFPSRANDIDKALQSVPKSVSVGYVPLVGRNTFWTVFINMKTAEVLAYAPLDSF